MLVRSTYLLVTSWTFLVTEQFISSMPTEKPQWNKKCGYELVENHKSNWSTLYTQVILLEIIEELLPLQLGVCRLDSGEYNDLLTRLCSQRSGSMHQDCIVWSKSFLRDGFHFPLCHVQSRCVYLMSKKTNFLSLETRTEERLDSPLFSLLFIRQLNTRND